MLKVQAPGPMLCHEEKAVPLGDEWVIEQKWDGWRFMFVIDGDRKVRSFAGRNGSDRTGQPLRVEQALRMTAINSVVDGELVATEPGVAVSTALAKGGDLMLILFDVLRLLDQDVTHLPWHQRRELLEALYEPLDGPEYPMVILSPYFADGDRQALHDRFVAMGGEGTVSKRRDSTYESGRSRAWVKVKATDTLEARVIGFKPGENEWAGTIGALEVELLDTGVKTTVGTRGTDMRQAITADPDAYLGRVLELKHYGLGKDGVPRHPGFVRWREDRD